MKRNFLLMLLLTLLPLVGWAATYNYVQVTWNPNSTSTTFTGGTMALPVPTVTYRTSSYGSTYTLSSSNYTVTWQYNGGSNVTVAEHAGTYTATITHTGDNWYTGNGSGTVTTTRTYTISRAANTISAP
ncbi:MAG: hypothetical protein J6W21_07655, partial [Bacteroidaceae bacterium]|nr:hypothetical protein [Bacteroidaceae bacterium]